MVKLDRVRAHILIDGHVQGVFFRDSMKRSAERLSVTGWVRNLPDGRVEAVVEGERKDVDAIVSWCHIGPSAASVFSVSVQREAYVGEFRVFRVLR